MPEQIYVAGDWGTTRLRLFLCADGQVRERRGGPGIGELAAADATEFASTLQSLIAPWVQAHGAIPVWLAGMVGSRNGWKEAPYIPCPADAGTLAATLQSFIVDGQKITIVPGMACINPRGAPDVLRGEETQIVGALAQHPVLAHGRRILALPGTHTKWVLIEDGRIVTFQTSLSGELFAVLRDHSMLTRAPRNDSKIDRNREENAFAQGAARARDLCHAPLGHLLFETRSRQLRGAMSPPEALAFLSGLLIEQDVQGALGLFAGEPARGACVPLIGTSSLTELYRIVLANHGIDATLVQGSAATLSGLRTFAMLASNPGAMRANRH